MTLRFLILIFFFFFKIFFNDKIFKTSKMFEDLYIDFSSKIPTSNKLNFFSNDVYDAMFFPSNLIFLTFSINFRYSFIKSELLSI